MGSKVLLEPRYNWLEKLLVRYIYTQLTEDSDEGLVVPVGDDLDEPLHDDVCRALAVVDVQIQVVVGQHGAVRIHVTLGQDGNYEDTERKNKWVENAKFNSNVTKSTLFSNLVILATRSKTQNAKLSI